MGERVFLSRIAMSMARYLLPGGSVSFWHTPIGAVKYDYPSLENYYIDFSSKTGYAGPFDDTGVPLLDYRGYIGLQYNPCAVAQYALGWYQLGNRGEDSNRTRFLGLADWLLNCLAIDDDGRGWWCYQFDLEAYGLRKPWHSALAQGQGLSVLLRAYCVTRQDTYLNAAKAAYRAMVLPVEEGGVLLREGDEVYLEEVVADRKTAILDGMIFSILGLRDYCYVIDDSHAEKLLEECLDTVEKRLPDYDLGFWSRADLYQSQPPMIASPFYHNLHIAQLLVLADLTGRNLFGSYSERWRVYADSRLNRLKAIISKSWFKIRYY